MIRLVATLLACLALQSAAPAAVCAHDHATIAVGGSGGGERVTLAAPDLHLWSLVPPRADALVAPSPVAAETRELRAHVVVARLWLRDARLLC